jgi:general secretion pathway protein E
LSADEADAEPAGGPPPPSAAMPGTVPGTTPGTAAFERGLIEHLVRDGRLDERGAQRARRAAASAGRRLAETLAQLGLVSERDIAAATAAVTGLPMVDREAFPAAAVLPDCLGQRFLLDNAVLPLQASADEILVAMAYPGDPFLADALALAAGRRVAARVAAASEIQAAIAQLYARARESGPAREAGDDEGYEIDIDRLRDLASEAPVVRAVEQLIAGAVAARASDIHIEPLEDRVRVRYRIDGRLEQVEWLPQSDHLAITSRIKIMAALNIAERRQPQDGRIRIEVDGRTLDVRVATAPTLHGESVVLRLLHRHRTGLELGALGFDGVGLARLREALGRPHGLLLVTGPTGSGKTTTLYAMLDQLNSVDRKILTVEDPIEYQIPGANQVQVNPKIGLSFANVLRSFLRHDPDIIMIGEIRDAETAEIAIHAALTGHLVLATLHTNDAPTAVTRLLEMGVADFLLASTLVAVVGQRLVRTCCAQCGGGGCERCRQTGFHGRTTIAEVMRISERIRSLILGRVAASAIRKEALDDGMQTMFAHGQAKVAAGRTTTEEVLRATADAATAG